MASRKINTFVLCLSFSGNVFCNDSTELQVSPEVVSLDQNLIEAVKNVQAVESIIPLQEVLASFSAETTQPTIWETIIKQNEDNKRNVSLIKNLLSAIQPDDGQTFSQCLEDLCQSIDFDKEELARKLILLDRTECLKALLRSGLNLERANENGENLFHTAAQNPYPNKSLNVLIDHLTESLNQSSLKENPQALLNLRVLLVQDKYGNTPIHSAYNNKKFFEGDAMLQLLQQVAASSLQDIQPSLEDQATQDQISIVKNPLNLSLLITDQKGMSLKDCRSMNRLSQIGSLVVSGLLFAAMIGTTLYEVLASDSSEG